jgi:hypothetical protein
MPRYGQEVGPGCGKRATPQDNLINFLCALPPSSYPPAFLPADFYFINMGRLEGRLIIIGHISPGNSQGNTFNLLSEASRLIPTIPNNPQNIPCTQLTGLV